MKAEYDAELPDCGRVDTTSVICDADADADVGGGDSVGDKVADSLGCVGVGFCDISIGDRDGGRVPAFEPYTPSTKKQ